MTQSGNQVIALMGPTASGKTGLAARLVQQFPLEIISVDSALVYRGMDIGTAKPDADLLKLAPHRLIDLCQPWEPYSAAQFARDAVAVIFISNPEDGDRAGLQARVACLYHLTLAESELTELLCEGKTLDEAAAARGVTPHTARSQLRRVFAKTGTSRQTDLVRLVLTGVSNLRDGAALPSGDPDGVPRRRRAHHLCHDAHLLPDNVPDRVPG